MRFRELLWRALRLRCALCGKGKLFSNWFRMHQECPSCAAKFEREPGFFLGSVYINYGLTSLIVAIAYPILLFQRVASNNVLLICSMAFILLFPVWFFRYSRSIWLGFDQFCDPRPESETELGAALRSGPKSAPDSGADSGPPSSESPGQERPPGSDAKPPVGSPPSDG